MVKHVWVFFLAVLCLLTGCVTDQANESTPEAVEADLVQLASDEALYCVDEFSYADPSEMYTLTVQLDVLMEGSGFFSHYAYAFCWEEEDGLTDSVYVTAGRADYFTEMGSWSSDNMFSNEQTYWLTWNEDGVSVVFGKAGGKQQHLDLAYPDRTVRTQTFTQEIEDAYKPEINIAAITADCYGSLERKVQIKDVYQIDVLSSNVVGLVGAPLQISYYDSVSNLQLTFCYDETQLRGIPEKNLIVLYYQADSQQYNEITQAVVDMDANTVTVPVTQEGVYLLTDAYEWYTVWGFDASKYAYEKDETAYISDWERECDTGDIMDIADIDWAMENAPVFHIETPEQLAGVVYYANVVADSTLTMYIENDLDLNGYDWAPMGWRKDGCSKFYIVGMGHKIANLTIFLPQETEVGWIGYADELYASDLCFTNASVTGKNYVGIFCGVDYRFDKLERISIQGEVVSEGACCGAFLGDSNAMNFNDCQADVIVNGEKTPYFSSYNQRQEAADARAEEVFTLTLDENYCITRDAVDDYDGLTWIISRDGERVLERNAENETVLDTASIEVVGAYPGCTYTIYLAAFVEGAYVRISNVLEYTVPEL